MADPHFIRFFQTGAEKTDEMSVPQGSGAQEPGYSQELRAQFRRIYGKSGVKVRKILLTAMKIGVLGSTSPLVSIHLQRLIAESTPARKDQDHLEVVSYTNPKVSDYENGAEKEAIGDREYHENLVTSAQLLVRAGVSMIAIPCNRAHARILDIQGRVPVPITNMVELTVRRILEERGKTQVGLLAGGATQKIYEAVTPNSGIRWIVPEKASEEAVVNVIRAIKEGGEADTAAVIKVAKELIEKGAKVLVLGYAKLSMVAEDVEKLGKPVVDPMRVLAEHLVDQARVV